MFALTRRYCTGPSWEEVDRQAPARRRHESKCEAQGYPDSEDPGPEDVSRSDGDPADCDPGADLSYLAG